MKKFLEKNKHLQEDEEDEEDQESMEDDELHSQEKEQQVVHRSGDRVCEQCGKRFSNGKALGGHIKVHFNQTLLPKKTTKFKTKSKPLSVKEAHEALDDVDQNSNISCYVCHKNFPSTKSLHGHMRLHRERDWKGVRPPWVLPRDQESNSSSSHNNVSEAEEEEEEEDCGDGYSSDHTIETDVDAANFLVNFKKIEERSVRKRCRIGEFSGKKMIDQESPVGYKGNPSSKETKFDCGSSKKVTMEASKSTGEAKVTKVLMKDIDFYDQNHKQIPRKPQESRFRRSGAISDVNMDGYSEFSSAYSNDEVGELSVKKPVEQSPDGYNKGTPSLKMKLKLDGRSNKTMEGGKRFGDASLVPSKLSIGGKGKAFMEEDDEDVADQSSWTLRPKKTMMMKSASKTHKQIPRKTKEFGTKYAEKGKYHDIVLDRAEEAHSLGHSIKQFVCNICPSKFSTGQALGGHMRGHNCRVLPVEKEPQATAEVGAMDLEDGEISPDPGKYDLDLNELPRESYDEEIGG